MNYRDVSVLLQRLREILLGRKHTLHPRFPGAIAPRSIPRPDLPRGPEYQYSQQYYANRNALHSVHPPVKVPIATMNTNCINFTRGPTPGLAWWWDGHCYYECNANSPTCMPDPKPPCESTTPPCPQTSDTSPKQ